MAQLKEQSDLLVKKYGSEYGSPYGWAAAAVRKIDPAAKGRRIGFRHLERAVGVPHFQPYYHLASHGVHPSAKSITFNVSVIRPRVLASGPTNAGFAAPGQCACISLAQVTSTLLCHKADVATVALLSAIESFVEEACQAFAAAHHKLLADEAEVKKGT